MPHFSAYWLVRKTFNMAFTLDQLTTLDAAIAQGALTVKYADKEVTYRSLKEMLELRGLMAAEVTPANYNDTKGRKFATFNSGLQ